VISFFSAGAKTAEMGRKKIQKVHFLLLLLLKVATRHYCRVVVFLIFLNK
jgi:hypothetical protein